MMPVNVGFAGAGDVGGVERTSCEAMDEHVTRY